MFKYFSVRLTMLKYASANGGYVRPSVTLVIHA